MSPVARRASWGFGTVGLALLAGWISLTAAEGDVPHAISDLGAFGAMMAGAVLLAKLLGPLLEKLAGAGSDRSSGGNHDKEDGRWQGELTATLHHQTAILRELLDEVKRQTEALNRLNQEIHQHDEWSKSVGIPSVLNEIRRGKTA